MKEYSGELYETSRFNTMSHCFARVHNNFLFVFNTPDAENPSNVYFLEKAVVRKWVFGVSSDVKRTQRLQESEVFRLPHPVPRGIRQGVLLHDGGGADAVDQSDHGRVGRAAHRGLLRHS